MHSFKQSGKRSIFMTLNSGLEPVALAGLDGSTKLSTHVGQMVDIVEKTAPSDSGLFLEYTGQEVKF